MRYVKTHSGQFNIHTNDISEWLHGIPGMNELSINICPFYVHGMNELSDNGLNELSVNGMNELFQKQFPCDANGLNEISVNGTN